MLRGSSKWKLKKFIKRALKGGYSDEKIVETLVNLGWNKDIVETTLEECKKKKEFIIKFEKKTNVKVKKIPEPDITHIKTIENIDETPKKVGINRRIEDLNDKFDELIQSSKIKKGKELKLPFKVRGQMKKLAEKGKVMVILLKINRGIDFTTAKITNGFIYVNDKIHNCTMDFVYLYKGKTPTIILPEWDLNPIGTLDYYEAVQEGRTVDAEDGIIRALEARKELMKPKLNGKVVIGIIIGAIIVGYLLFGGQN